VHQSLETQTETDMQDHVYQKPVMYRYVDELKWHLIEISVSNQHSFILIERLNSGEIIKPQLAIARLGLHASVMSICSSVRLSVCVCRQNAKNAIFSKTKQFRAMVSIDDL